MHPRQWLRFSQYISLGHNVVQVVCNIAPCIMNLGSQLRVLRASSSSFILMMKSGFSTSSTTKLQAGILGLPNVGKSTLFNALTESSQAQSANFPFCTIDPNHGFVVVPDDRLERLQQSVKSKKVVPATLEFVDIAGIVKGASKGEGLGNKFLQNIREVDALIHVVRCFEDEDIIHVSGTINPIEDMETIELELILSDIEQCEKRQKKVERDVRVNREGAVLEHRALEKLLHGLGSFKSARAVLLDDEERASVAHLGLLSAKKVIFAANVAEYDLPYGNKYVKQVEEASRHQNAGFSIISAKLESELLELLPNERRQFLTELGVHESGCQTLIRKAFDLLDLRTFFTIGPEEVRAWTIKKGFTAPEAAGVIHTDLESSFIQAEVLPFESFILDGVLDSKKWSRKGKDYVVEEGDIILFKSGLGSRR